jgi:DNA-binding LytR/AlgR family response regulator
MNLSCYIIDDESHGIDILQKLIDSTPGLELLGANTNPLDALQNFAVSGWPDIIFLDIEMPQLSGLQVADLSHPSTRIIFSTAYAEFAVEAFNRSAFDYLLKPITQERFLRSITNLRNELAPKTAEERPDYFFIKTDTKGKVIRIQIADILYVEALANYVQIWLAKEKHLAYLTTGEMEEFLPAADFSRIHKSFIVSHRAIQSLEQGMIRLNSGTLLPIGRVYKDAFMNKTMNHLFRSKRDNGNT